MKNLSFRKRLYCSVIAILSMFAVCGNHLHAAVNGSESGDVSMAVQQGPKVGDIAPDFTTMIDGENVSLEEMGPQVKVINFTSSNFASLKEECKNYDIIFVDISSESSIAQQYGVSTPVVFIINPDNKIIDIISNTAELSAKLKEIFG